MLWEKDEMSDLQASRIAARTDLMIDGGPLILVRQLEFFELHLDARRSILRRVVTPSTIGIG